MFLVDDSDTANGKTYTNRLSNVRMLRGLANNASDLELSKQSLYLATLELFRATDPTTPVATVMQATGRYPEPRLALTDLARLVAILEASGYKLAS